MNKMAHSVKVDDDSEFTLVSDDVTGGHWYEIDGYQSRAQWPSIETARHFARQRNTLVEGEIGGFTLVPAEGYNSIPGLAET